MHKHLLNYVQSRQVKISGIKVDEIIAIKEQVLPVLASTVMNIKFKGCVDKKVTYMTRIHALRSPMISGMPAVVSVDNNNNCKIIVDNCALYDIFIQRNDVIGLMDIEAEDLIPLEDYVISSILKYQKCQLTK